MERYNFMSSKSLIIFLFLFFSGITFAREINIALIKDGPAQKNFLAEEKVKQEIISLLGSEFNPRFVNTEKTTGDWSLKGINQIIKNNYQDQSVDIIVTLGAVSSNEIAKLNSHPKPTIAAITIDPVAQSFPVKGDTSGKNNFTYIADIKEAGYEIVFFRDFVQVRKLAVLIEPILSESWPQFIQLLDQASRNFDVEFLIIPMVGSPQEAVQSIPEEAGAALVGVLSQYSDEEVSELAQLLIEQKLPSYSFIGEEGVEAGFLVTANQMGQARTQMSRRIAIDIQRILLGTNAQELSVSMQFNNRVIYNKGTGLAINFSPKWNDVLNAKVINKNQFSNRRAFNVREAVLFSINNNLDLQAAAINIDLASRNVKIAKSNLYPSLSLSASYNKINKEQVIAGANPEQRADAQLNFSQLLYSESTWANYHISQLLSENEIATYEAKVLDIAQQAATAYLDLLRAKSAEAIRISNLEVTRKNLELAENRLRVGASGKSDVLRWKSQLATDRKDLFSSEASRKNAELQLARIMNLPEGILVDARTPEISDLLNILTSDRFKKFVGNEIQWNGFQKFYKMEAVKNSPELKGFDSLLDINERELLANQRGHYVPDVSLVAQAGRNINQSGFGALDNIEQNQWMLGIQASLPFDLSGQRRSNTSKKKLEKKQIELQRKALKQNIVTVTGQALFNVGSSYPSIELSHISADAASESLSLVANAYANGRVSIAELLDAQNNALNAKLLAANAEYAFLQDYIQLMRTAGDFKPLLKGQFSNQWFDRLIRFFRENGIEIEAQ